MCWIQTYSGLKFHVLTPKVENITVIDCAHALSMICRYNGHCKEFYSVAQHSVLVSELIETEYNYLSSSDECRWGLLHDLSEIYLSDVPRPVKPFLNGYRELEKKYEILIAKKFNLTCPIPDVVHEVDSRILKTEREVLFEKYFRWSSSLESFDYFDVEIIPWEPRVAKNKFIERFETVMEDFNE